MTAHHFLRAQNAFSCCDQKPKLTSRKRKYILSHNRDSRDWVGYRDDWLSSSAMWSRTPPLCSASLGIGFNLRPEAIGCSSSKHHIQTWWHLEERGTPSFLWFSLGIRRLFSPPRKFPSYLIGQKQNTCCSQTDHWHQEWHYSSASQGHA